MNSIQIVLHQLESSPTPPTYNIVEFDSKTIRLLHLRCNLDGNSHDPTTYNNMHKDKLSQWSLITIERDGTLSWPRSSRQERKCSGVRRDVFSYQWCNSVREMEPFLDHVLHVRKENVAMSEETCSPIDDVYRQEKLSLSTHFSLVDRNLFFSSMTALVLRIILLII